MSTPPVTMTPCPFGSKMSKSFWVPCYNLATCDLDLLLSPKQVLLTFTKQKNGTLAKLLKHGSTGQVLMSPVLAVLCCICHLHQHHAPPATALHTVYLPAGTTTNVTSNQLAVMLCHTCRTIPKLGLHPSNIFTHALCASGAMALLCARVDPLLVQLIGRWKSDAMLHYLYTCKQPTCMTLPPTCSWGGEFKLVPNQTLPKQALSLLASCPVTDIA
jgi:hypothetical protein